MPSPPNKRRCLVREGRPRSPSTSRVGVDRVGGHAPVRRELPAGDGDHAARRGADRMPARQVGGARGATLAQERPQPGPGADDVGLGELVVGDAVDRPEQVVDVGGGARRVVERSVVVGVGGADVGGVAPRHDEDRSPVVAHGDDGRDVVADLGPRHRDVDALGRTDRGRVCTLVERADVVRPDPGRVHDRTGADEDLLAVGLDARADDAVAVLHDAAHGRRSWRSPRRGSPRCGRW